jgi:flagellar assembly protein FliH
MSLSARRLTGPVDTGRFPWQRQPEAPPVAQPGVVALFPRKDEEAEAAARQVGQLQLPSVAAERLAALEQEAYTRGFADGERAGTQAATSQADAMVRRLSSALTDLASLRRETMRRSERDLVRLALAIGEGIVLREVEADRGLLLAMAQKAIARMGERVTATIKLNPKDYQLLTQSGRTLGGDGVTVTADPAVPPAGCLIQTPFGEIDAGIDTQTRELARALIGSEELGDVPSSGRTSYGLAAGA